MTLPLRVLETILRAVPDVTAYLKPETRAMIKAMGDILGINAAYHDAITQALIDYLEGGSVTAPRNDFKRAMVEAFGAAFELGWTDGGAELPFEGEALQWYNNRVTEETGNIDGAFQDARELRKDSTFDALAWASARADGYTSTVMSVYNAAVMFAKGSRMLTWHLGNTEKHCETCKRLDGKQHPAYWYIDNNYIPRQPGAGMDCAGYNCDCSLTDRSGNEVTL